MKEDFSAKFIITLNQEVSIWEDAPSEFMSESHYEINRLVKRAEKGSGNSVAMSGYVYDIYSEVCNDVTNSTAYFTNALNVADFINRKF